MRAKEREKKKLLIGYRQFCVVCIKYKEDDDDDDEEERKFHLFDRNTRMMCTKPHHIEQSSMYIEEEMLF